MSVVPEEKSRNKYMIKRLLLNVGKNYIGHVQCLEEHNIEWNIILCLHPFGYYLILVLKSHSSVKEKVEMLLFSFMPICSTQNSVRRGGENVFMEN